MLEKNHILWYREDILRANRIIDKEIEEAEKQAKRALCSGCDYCQNTMRHKLVLQETFEKLLAIVHSLKEGARSARVFSKVMYHDAMLYRGFITDTGEYVPIFKMDHDTYRSHYTERYGEERAYSMINVHARRDKTEILFCDRKHAPRDTQCATLRDLMIDAEGSLCFRFMYDTKHPILA